MDKHTKPGGKKAPRKPPQRTPAVVLYARVDSELGQAFLDHIEGLKPKPPMTAVLEVALEEYLAKRGLWPVSDGGD